MRVVVITPPDPIVSWEEAKAHLRLDTDDEQAYVVALIAAAQQWIDGPGGWLGRCVGVQTLELRAQTNSFNCIQLPYPPVVEVEEATIDGEPLVVAERVDGLFSIVSSSAAMFGPLIVRYRAGYETIPAPIKQAILLLVGQWYSFRSNVAEDGAPAEIPMAVEALLSTYRVWL
jgi:hypothetical protein